METINIQPTGTGTLRTYLAAYTDGYKEGKNIAIELYRMEKTADEVINLEEKYNNLIDEHNKLIDKLKQLINQLINQ